MGHLDATRLKACFVISPISDIEGYLAGHFERTFLHLVKPACASAGFEAIRADTVRATNYIALDILKKIIESEMVVCDLSGRNPNVLYELGIRQAFNKPVTLIKDRKTDRIFDIQGLRTLEYDDQLRVDTVQKDIASLSAVIRETATPSGGDVNSLVKLLGVMPATISSSIELSERDTIIMNAISGLSDQVSSLSKKVSGKKVKELPEILNTANEYIEANRDDELINQFLFLDRRNLGKITGVDREKGLIRFADAEGARKILRFTSSRFKDLEVFPF